MLGPIGLTLGGKLKVRVSAHAVVVNREAQLFPLYNFLRSTFSPGCICRGPRTSRTNKTAPCTGLLNRQTMAIHLLLIRIKAYMA